MDPICHTLVGASLGATGLEKKTRYGRATLIIAANLPDVDVISHAYGETAAYAFRRGITHGLPALVVLPVLLAVAVKLFARCRPGTDRDASFRWLLLLSAVGVATHPALDWLNNYGMRWLIPIADEWVYGDTLFIVDWVLWLALVTGLLATRWLRPETLRWFQRPASVSLAFVLAYIAMSFGITQWAEREALARVADDPPQDLMASPVPLNPLRRDILLEYATEYRLGTVRFAPRPQFEWSPTVITKGDPALLDQAREQRQGRQFLHWARFPYAVVDAAQGGTLVWLADARYVTDIEAPRMRSFGFVVLEIPAGERLGSE
jgi:inner membrane protein